MKTKVYTKVEKINLYEKDVFIASYHNARKLHNALTSLNLDNYNVKMFYTVGNEKRTDEMSAYKYIALYDYYTIFDYKLED